MKKFFKIAMMFVAACTLSTGLVACGDDDDDNTTDPNALNETELSIQQVTKQYLENVVFTTYTNLANATDDLYEQLDDAKAKFRAGTLTQGDIDQICAKFLEARTYWEASEAFLYGPATTFGIDPHIDTWPLDLDALAVSLSNSAQVAMLDNGDDGIAYAGAKLGQELLGFHGIEFIIFRDGKNRTLASLKANETDEAFEGKTVSGEQELVYAVAVAGDLRDKCFQLEVAWRGESAAKAHQERVEECEFETQVGDFYYGENMLNAKKAGSTYATWQAVLIAIFDSGCSNICAEVANTKIGNAWSGEDVNYIESPYSKKSFEDFYENISSIKNSLYGGINLSSANANSLLSLVQKKDAALATKLNTRLDAALKALDTCRKGTAFVDIINSGVKDANVQAAIDAINDLDDALQEGATWASKL
jgi:predicted lipoprotein